MARRVNTRFLTILTIVVVGLGLIALLAKQFLVRESPEKYVSAGQQAMADKKWQEAVNAFGRAVSLNQKDPSLWVAYGDALNQLSPTDVEYMLRARKAWDQALVVQPDYKPALDRMMQFWSDVANLDPRPEVFAGLNQTATKLFQADSKNVDAEVAIQTSQIRPWLAGVEKDREEVKRIIGELQRLIKKYPDNADLPMFAAQAKLRFAERARQQDQAEEAKTQAADAQQIVDDALKRTEDALKLVDPNNRHEAEKKASSMYFSAAQVAQAQETLFPDKTLDYRKRKQELYNRARELAKPDDPLYTFIYIGAARAAADKPEAEKILRSLMKERPDDQQVRLALAEQLATDQGKRDEALQILDQPFAASEFKGPKAYMVRELQIRTLVTATNLRLDKFASANTKEREDLLPKIKDGLSKISTKDGEGPRYLRLYGKLQRLQGDPVEAIKTLDRARALAENQGGSIEMQGDRIDRWEVIDMLARAYVETGQTGRAKELLTQLVVRFPTYDPARMLLTQLMLKEGDTEGARPHVEYFKAHKPNDPEVIKFDLQMAAAKEGAGNSGAQSDEAIKQKVKAVYSRLPEDTAQQVLDKVNAAMVVNQEEDASRLLNKVLKTPPNLDGYKSDFDYDLARMAVRVYRAQGDVDKAREFVTASLAAHPNNEKLQLLNKQVQDLTPEALMKVALEETEKNPDPFAKAMIKANIYRRLNQPDDALKQLLAAQQLQPNNTDVTGLLFSQYLWQNQFDKAEALLDKLTAANQDQCNGKLFRYKLAMAQGDYNKALDYGRDLVSNMGMFSQSWIALAQAQHALGNADEALKNYLAALERQSDSVEAYQGVIQCYYLLSRPADARRKIVEARRAFPANPTFREMEVQYELSYGDPTKAIATREELYKKNPDKAEYIRALGQVYLASARAKEAKADTREQAPAFYAKAKDMFRKGIAKFPDQLAFYADFAETCARSRTDLPEAEQLLKQLDQRDAWKGKSDVQALLAEVYAVGGKLAESQAALQSILAKDPKNVDAQVRLSNLLLSQKKVDESLKALENNGTDPKLARRRVEILTSVNRFDDADTVINEALAKSPSNLDLLHLAAGVNIGRQQYAVAEKHLQRALEINPKDPTTHYFVGLLRMNQASPNYDEAMKELAIGKDSPSMGTDARFALADCMRRRSNTDGAIRELEAALSAQPTNKRVRLGLLDAYAVVQPPRYVDAERVISDAEKMPGYTPDPDLLQRKAAIAQAKGEPKKAIDAIKDALAVKPNDPGLEKTYVELLVKLNRNVDVIAEVDRLEQAKLAAWWAYQARAVAKRNQGHKDESIKDFEAALSAANADRDDNANTEIVRTMGDVMGPDEVINRIQGKAEKDDHWKIMIARLQQTKGDNESAVKTLQQVLAKDEQLVPADRESALRFGGTLFLIVKQPEESRKCYEKLLKITPDDMTALNNIACLLAEEVQPPRPAEGLKYSQHAYDLMDKGGRKDAYVYDTHGWLLTLAGQVDQGIDTLRRANEIKSIPDAHYHLAKAYMKKEYWDQAMRELETSMDLIREYEREKTQFDPTLKNKVEAAQATVTLNLKNGKKSAPTAAAVGGTNVSNVP